MNLSYCFSLGKERKILETVNDCIVFKSVDVCREALIQIEALQIDQSSIENYSCQTRLLGLQADIIMYMQQLRMIRFDEKNFAEVEQFCENL
tara:strand:+ start:300 stop:575 length:276 start_codon:yes stop_codon:yes gene_type:complete